MSKDQTPYVDEVRAIIEQIYKKIEHPYVEKYVDPPLLAENRLALLYLYLHDQGLASERVRTLCMTVALVQLGLDMHEGVKVVYEETQTAERNRQLTVLAGDYYSSTYYHLLAEAGEIEAIQVLARAIERVNEAKMKLYLAEQESKLTWDEYMSLRKTIDTSLYVAMVNKYAAHEQSRRFWSALFEETSAVECMIGEWEQLKWQQQAPFGFSRYLMQKPGTTIAQVAASVEAKAMELISICEQLIRSLHPAETRNTLTWITSRYSHRVNRLKRVVEEM
jgi:heptaprenyl diphosphate synthase